VRRIVSFPHMGDYWIGIKALGELLDCDVFIPPPITKRTLELGSRHSPEFVCIPFKYNLGNFIEALDNGANFLVQCGGGCRFGYYGEVQEAILRDMGYDFEFVRLMGNIHPIKMYKDFHRINPDLKFWRFLKRFLLAIRMGRALDEVDDFIRKNIGFEVEPGGFEDIAKRLRVEMDETRDMAALKRIHAKALSDCAAVPVKKPERPLRVGVVGELYVLMEPFSNYFLEQELGRRGVEVHRFITITSMITDALNTHFLRDMIKHASPYLKYHIGADGTESVGRTNKLMKEGFDGMVHLKPFGCMPEVNAMSALQRISREHTFPILFLSYDSQTSETGLHTRLEAFCDMLEMRRGAA
jgi:predicted nucleotide-binding protein (sugar kinase/HSP70/actin superfamily)